MLRTSQPMLSEDFNDLPTMTIPFNNLGTSQPLLSEDYQKLPIMTI